MDRFTLSRDQWLAEKGRLEQRVNEAWETWREIQANHPTYAAYQHAEAAVERFTKTVKIKEAK